MGRTRKVGIVGRLGPRYGLKIRKNLKEIEELKKKRKKCPRCQYDKVKRIAAGIWYCKKCNAKFTGGAYTIRSAAMESITKIGGSE